MATIDFIYDTECPNVAAARENLRLALARLGIGAPWTGHRIGDPAAPERTRGYGSPTVLVDGRDVAGVAPANDVCCRIYHTSGSGPQAPGVEQIVAALERAVRGDATHETGPGGWRSAFAMLPGVGVSFLPKAACPACWPAYSGFLSSLGLGFLIDTRWLLSLTAAFLLLAVGALAYRARQRRGFGPFFAGFAAALGVLVGKFTLESDAAMYAGLIALVAASIWNTWPRRAEPACPACAASGVDRATPRASLAGN